MSPAINSDATLNPTANLQWDSRIGRGDHGDDVVDKSVRYTVQAAEMNGLPHQLRFHPRGVADSLLTPPKIPSGLLNGGLSSGGIIDASPSALPTPPHTDTPPMNNLSRLSNSSNLNISFSSFGVPGEAESLPQKEDTSIHQTSNPVAGSTQTSHPPETTLRPRVQLHLQRPSIVAANTTLNPSPVPQNTTTTTASQNVQSSQSSLLPNLLNNDYDEADSDSDYSGNDARIEEDDEQELMNMFRPPQTSTFTTDTSHLPLSDASQVIINQNGTEEIIQNDDNSDNFFLSPIESSELSFLQWDLFKMDFITNNVTEDDQESEDDEFIATLSDDEEDWMDIVVPEDELRQLEGEKIEASSKAESSPATTTSTPRRSPRIPKTVTSSHQGDAPTTTTTTTTTQPPTSSAALTPQTLWESSGSTPEKANSSPQFSHLLSTPPLSTTPPSLPGQAPVNSSTSPNPKYSPETPLHVTLKAQFLSHFQLLLTNYLISLRENKDIDLMRSLLVNLFTFRESPFLPENFKKAWGQIESFLEACNPETIPKGVQRKTKNQFLWESLGIFKHCNLPLDPHILGIIDEDIKGIRSIFVPAEDRLLAIGIDQYGNDYAMIAQELLPGKKEDQVLNRIRNITAKRMKDNPIYITLERKKGRDKKKLLEGVRRFGQDFKTINQEMFDGSENGRTLSLLYKEIDRESKDEALKVYKQIQENKRLKRLEETSNDFFDEMRNRKQRKKEKKGKRKKPGPSSYSVPQAIPINITGQKILFPSRGPPARMMGLPGNITVLGPITSLPPGAAARLSTTSMPLMPPRTPPKTGQRASGNLHGHTTHPPHTPQRDDVASVVNFPPDMPTPPQDGTPFWTPPTNSSRKRERGMEFFSHSGKKRRVDVSPHLKSPLVTPIPSEIVLSPQMSEEAKDSDAKPAEPARYPISRDAFHVEYLDVPPKRQLFPTSPQSSDQQQEQIDTQTVNSVPQTNVKKGTNSSTATRSTPPPTITTSASTSSTTPSSPSTATAAPSATISAPSTTSSPSTVIDPPVKPSHEQSTSESAAPTPADSSSRPWTTEEQSYILRCLKECGTEATKLERKWDQDREEGKISRSNRELHIHEPIVQNIEDV
eukprot:CAMPEP_0117453620 /NCGR_PEP_ID=MMETSP0759-20121206/10326_1 /TAXON_ID=63605 /ORGANISM="Percolomonas cosmopolitus, Strain WS" /LENGTH=1108 /DNA_ID=CAMNT_0005246675 /DNA_START=385 /DNA_END=3711 /DNA_ORIENTATION=+